MVAIYHTWVVYKCEFDPASICPHLIWTATTRTAAKVPHFTRDTTLYYQLVTR
jgi:hypothetical protein